MHYLVLSNNQVVSFNFVGGYCKIEGGGALSDAARGVVVGAVTGAVHASRETALVL